MEESSEFAIGYGRYERSLRISRQHEPTHASCLKAPFSRAVLRFPLSDERDRRMLGKFERYPLTFGPTPIENLSRLGAHLGGQVELYAKREDCNSGLAYGGNKLRKLEYIVPDAIASNADTLVSIGGVQSNHTRMIAAVAAKIGMKCRLVQEAWVPHEDAV